MGTGWAVASATVLGLSVAQLVVGAPPSAEGPARVLVGILLVAAFASWAYAHATAAYGARGALLGILGLVLAWGLAGGLLWLRRAPGPAGMVLPALLVLAALPGAWSVLREIRARRGPLRWGAAAGILLPTLVLGGLLALLERA